MLFLNLWCSIDCLSLVILICVFRSNPARLSLLFPLLRDVNMQMMVLLVRPWGLFEACDGARGGVGLFFFFLHGRYWRGYQPQTPYPNVFVDGSPLPGHVLVCAHSCSLLSHSGAGL